MVTYHVVDFFSLVNPEKMCLYKFIITLLMVKKSIWSKWSFYWDCNGHFSHCCGEKWLQTERIRLAAAVKAAHSAGIYCVERERPLSLDIEHISRAHNGQQECFASITTAAIYAHCYAGLSIMQNIPMMCGSPIEHWNSLWRLWETVCLYVKQHKKATKILKMNVIN